MAERVAGAVERPDRNRPLANSWSRQRHRPGNDLLRLRRSVDVRAAVRRGASAGGPGAVVHVRRRPDGGASRMAVVAGRRLGKAVDRNRAKRRLRAAASEATPPRGFDIVLVARPGALTADYPTLRRTLMGSLTRAIARAEESQ